MKYEYGGIEYEGESFYCYPASDVLMNKFNITDGGKCVSHTNENVIVNRKYFEHGDVLFAITGEGRRSS